MQRGQRRPGGGGAAGCLGTGHSNNTALDALSQAAFAYAAAGWPIFPCQPRGKQPLGRLAPNGVKTATTDPKRVAAWWRACPEANIGLAAGHHFWALDCDPDHGGHGTLAELAASMARCPAP